MINFAYADGTQSVIGSSNFLVQLLPLLLIMLVFWFLIIRPQQKKMKAHQKLITEIKKDDKVITNSGIIGTISKVADSTFSLEISSGVEVQIEKQSIAGLYNPNTNNVKPN